MTGWEASVDVPHSAAAASGRAPGRRRAAYFHLSVGPARFRWRNRPIRVPKEKLMADYTGAGTAASAGVGAGVLPVTGGVDSIWFWVVMFVLISAGFAVLRLIPRRVNDSDDT
jgi:hypothetical protein